ncbi:MAG: hypothetical protein NVS1B11_28740 [Terriglobales bacterium]
MKPPFCRQHTVGYIPELPERFKNRLLGPANIKLRRVLPILGYLLVGFENILTQIAFSDPRTGIPRVSSIVQRRDANLGHKVSGEDRLVGAGLLFMATSAKRVYNQYAFVEAS